MFPVQYFLKGRRNFFVWDNLNRLHNRVFGELFRVAVVPIESESSEIVSLMFVACVGWNTEYWTESSIFH